MAVFIDDNLSDLSWSEIAGSVPQYELGRWPLAVVTWTTNEDLAQFLSWSESE